MVPNVSKINPQAKIQEKFAFEKSTVGGITLLTLHGTLDHSFEGRKIAESVSTKKVVVNMRDVRRFASWGMSSWMDFLRINAKRDLYLVECSTYATSQINLVTGLLGHGKLTSFYASYRCGSCSEEFETLINIPRDRATIPELPASQLECTTCGGRTRLEEYPAAFFETIAARPVFDVDDEALAYFRSSLKYDMPVDLTRFRAHRRFRKGYTYLRLSGSIGTLNSDALTNASEGTTIVDLEQIVLEPGQMAPWRTYVQAARTKVKSLQLLGCPVGFLETAVVVEDLHNNLKIRTFALAYDCVRCKKPTIHMVDVAENLERLVEGLAPAVHCITCKAMLVATLTPEQVALVRALPARDLDPALDKFLVSARAEPVDKLENCLIAAAPKRPDGPKAGIAPYIAMGLAAVLVAGVVIFMVGRKQQDETSASNGQTPVVAPVVAPPAFQRPDWILSDVPSSAYCHDLINRLMCVGVSSYRPTRDEAVVEANDAALEELVSTVGLKISDPAFRDILAGYSGVRSKALSALQAAELDRTTPAYAAANSAVGKARKRVVEILQSSGGAAVPTRRTDWYWEEYAAAKGGTELLVFVRYDVTIDAVRALVDRYSATTPVLDSIATTAFPALAWQYADFTGGATLTKVGRTFAEAGIAPQSMVMAVGDQRVGDASSLARRIDEWKHTAGALTVTVKTGDAPAKSIEVPHAK